MGRIQRKFRKCLNCDGQVYAKNLCKYHYYRQLQKQNAQKKRLKKKLKKIKRNIGGYAYKQARKAFFLNENNHLCKARVDGVCMIHATDVHHMAGRIGELLTNETYFMPVCRACHQYIHDHNAWAEENGFIIRL